MDIHLRVLDKAELALVRRVADIVWPITFQEILSPEQMAYMMEMMYAAEVMEREYAEGVSFCGVFDGEKPIGYLAWGRSDSAPDTAKLHKCYLLPEYQGKGIGSMMLNKAKVYAKEAGFAKLRLNVNRNNAKAIKAYARNGFQTVETVDRAIGHGFFMNDYVMEAEI